MTTSKCIPSDPLGNRIPREIVERDLLPIIRDAQAHAKENERDAVTQLEDGTLVVPMRGIRAKLVVSADAQRTFDHMCACGPLGSEEP